MPSGQNTIRVRVVPNARRNESLGAMPGTGEIKIRLAAPPVDGKANKALIAFLSDALGLSKGSVEIVRGSSARRKVIALEGVDAGEAFRVLSGADE